nr:MazG nucleotide pyrophosphohydrolase domain-containing protein [Ardenticatena sp.]
MTKLTFDDFQAWFREYDAQRGLTDDPPLAVLARLMEEVGEIARHVLHLEGEKPLDECQRDEERAALALELADAFIFLTKLANLYAIDWTPTIHAAIQKAEARFGLEEGQREAARRRAARLRRHSEDDT